MIAEIDFNEPATVRLISTAYIDEPAVKPLADDDDEIEILNRLEAMTSARLSPLALPVGVDPAELLNETFGYGWSLINAAFCHARPPGNRFNGEERGAWYCAFGPRALQTCQAEIVYHRTRALREAGSFHDIGRYRELIAVPHRLRCERPDLENWGNECGRAPQCPFSPQAGRRCRQADEGQSLTAWMTGRAASAAPRAPDVEHEETNDDYTSTRRRRRCRCHPTARRA